jgi:hypothetical protein
MTRHRIDVVALIIGLAFVMYGAGFLVNEITGKDFNTGFAAAMGLVVLGVVALLVTLLRPKRETIDAASGAPTAHDESDQGS